LKVDEVVKYIEACNERESTMIRHLQDELDHDKQEVEDEKKEEGKDGEEEKPEEQEQEEERGPDDETEDGGESTQPEDPAEEVEEEEEENISEDHPTRKRDEAKWQDGAWGFEWMGLTAWSAADYLLLQGNLAPVGVSIYAGT
jgi:hypothetical protein